MIELYCKNGNQYHTINVHATYKPMWEQLSGLIAMIEGRMADAPSFDELILLFWLALLRIGQSGIIVLLPSEMV